MPTTRRRQAGFTLIEVMIVLAITLLIAALLYKVTRVIWLLYQTETHVTERGFSGVRALDDMAVEIARAGYGLGDEGPVFLGTLDGTPSFDAITLRSNPEGIVGLLEEELADPEKFVAVEGAALFAEGDEVLIVDDEPNKLERAQVTGARPHALRLRSHDMPGRRFKRPWSSPLTRVLKVREVGFYLTRDRTGVSAVARKAPGQSEQVLVRYVEALQFDYLVAPAEPPGPRSLLRRWARSTANMVRITLRLRPNPTLPPIMVPPRMVLVSHEPQWASIPFDPAGDHAIALAGVIGQDPVSGAKTVRIHAWHDTTPVF